MSEPSPECPYRHPLSMLKRYPMPLATPPQSHAVIALRVWERAGGLRRPAPSHMRRLDSIGAAGCTMICRSPRSVVVRSRRLVNTPPISFAACSRADRLNAHLRERLAEVLPGDPEGGKALHQGEHRGELPARLVGREHGLGDAGEVGNPVLAGALRVPGAAQRAADLMGKAVVRR